MTGTELSETLATMSDEDLEARRRALAFDARFDGDAREALRQIEDEIARRARAERRKHGTRH